MIKYLIAVCLLLGSIGSASAAKSELVHAESLGTYVPVQPEESDPMEPAPTYRNPEPVQQPTMIPVPTGPKGAVVTNYGNGMSSINSNGHTSFCSVINNMVFCN